MNMPTDIYRLEVDRLIAEQSGEILLNGSANHASIIVERMFANASDAVRIVSRRLDPRIYGTHELVEQAKLFFGVPERKTEILVESKDELISHPLLKAISHEKNVELRHIPERLHEAVAFNFSTMDDCGYRFEEDKKKAVAMAKFGDLGFTKRLNTLFDSLWDQSTLIEITPETV